MDDNRMMELLKKAVSHIESFEEDRSGEVLASLGFTKNDLAAINFKFDMNERDKLNVGYVSDKIFHNGEVVWLLSDAGSEYMFADQVEEGGHWHTTCVPFERYSHYIYEDESTGHCVGYAWYGPDESYIEEFDSRSACLDWLVPDMEKELAASRTLRDDAASHDQQDGTIQVKVEPDIPDLSQEPPQLGEKTIFGTGIKVFYANRADQERLANSIDYWCNGLGELHCGGVDISEEDLPLELQRAYDELWTDEFGSLCYLVKTPQGYGVALINEYDNCYADDCGITMENLFESALADAVEISQHSEFEHADIFVGEHSGFCDCHEVFVIFPASTPVKEFRAAAAKLDELAYQSAKQPNASLSSKIQSASTRASAPASLADKREKESSL